MQTLQKIFEPESIAVIGASREGTKLGHMVLDNIINGGYRDKVYPVNPKAEEINGLQSYPAVEQIPYPVDLAIIVIPAQYVVPVIKQCANKGVKGAVIISAGFSEAGKQGEIWEKQILEIARVAQMRVLGPNCLGFLNPKIKLNASFSKNLPKPGNLGFISQSGAFGTAMLDWAEESNIGFDLFVSIGNKLDIAENDILEYWIETGVPQVIVSYLEDIKNGKDFNKFNFQITKTSPHLVLKPGITKAGREAIKSHTGALAGADIVISTALKQFGSIRAEGMHDLFDMVRVFSLQPIPNGNKIAVVTNAGGPAVMTTDYIEMHGMKIARFDERTLQILKAKLPRTANIHDPVDVIGDALADRYADAIDAVLGDPNVDALIVLLTPQVMTQIEETANYIGRLAREHGKTVAAAFVGGKFVEEGRNRLEELGIPVFHYPDRAVLALKAMNEYRQYKAFVKTKKVLGANEDIMKIDISYQMQVEDIFKRVRMEGRKNLRPSESLQIAKIYGITIPQSRMVITEDEAVSTAEEFGFPVVMKVASEKLLHKTEVGGVELNLESKEDVLNALNKLKGILAGELGIPIEALREGIEMQKQITAGHEVMIGVKKNKNFGHLVIFGMGGIFTEIYKDFSARLAPFGLEDAKMMLNETKVFQILKGFRNLPERDTASVAENILRVSRLAADFPIIKEMDINPLIVLNKGEGSIAVDVKIVI